MTKKPVALIILDGVAYGKDYPGNAFKLANTKNFDRYVNEFPNSTLGASGESVGLPEGQMGNSEVGHLNIGAGRVVYQSLTRINIDIRTGQFFENEYFTKAINHAKEKGTKLHLFGLLSDGGVHSHIDHIAALLKLAKIKGLEDVYVHAFLDGRDVGPKSALGYVEQLEENMDEIGIGKIATVSGRYYAMDRDKNFDLTQKAYDAMTIAKGEKYKSAKEGIEASYNNDILDEFVLPFVVCEDGMVRDEDAVIFANFRPDRAIQLSTAISNPENVANYRKEGKPALDPSKGPKDVYFVSMMHYAESVKADIAFPLQRLSNTFGEVVSNEGLKQLRIAETQKYAHVTFFFDGGIDKEIKGSKRILIDSPTVETYDLMPEMSAYEVTDAVLKEIETDTPDVIVLNFANCDMVGHTGVIDAAIKAVETVDECFSKVVEAIEAKGGVSLITADHGNAEKLVADDGNPFTAHTSNPVPLIITDKTIDIRDGGILGDLAPTMLEYLGIKQPDEMDGKSLLIKK
ncbi:2,3-bisphosphoglycerate-independent phosphoglycerate mutase [Haloplasma contractile]|uniref:2,3-bisphosphoglycerate-independent phosphoglycerate mutase n=1 Tax=Haloplasma contractile SSD-17B TaxID=1033810 RepID=U2FME3_9MOLU|nr:2,3-bisphosphoglycerate-independent phosphoglycerate mutase [Haloplasma contractile]ERJ12339.1 23-bisphosphoglycerate-independent phosphoglycerate mutase protein [Haloplasma contractile SSD-17B]